MLGPVLFDLSRDYRVLANDSVDVVLFAFQGPARSKLEHKLSGRLKSLGCCMDGPVAWRVLKRVCLDGR